MNRQNTETTLLTSIPDGKLCIIPLESMDEFAGQIDRYIHDWRKERMSQSLTLHTLGDSYLKETYIVPPTTPRFGSGEAKGTVTGSVRGDDVYILVDVCNYSKTYRIGGYTNVKSPDDHFQDLKRVIAACSGAAKRINVIMPYLYEGRRMKRDSRDSLDCSSALQELEAMGVHTIITYDAHDARVQNAIPMCGFETLQPTYQFIKNILRQDPDLTVDSDHLMIISPDEGGMSRAIYMATVLGVNMGTFYHRHDYSKREGGKSPIVAHEFLGSDVTGKDMIILDDMISSGETVLMTAKWLKERGARNIYICATFGMFTRGLDAFDKAYKAGTFNKLLTTNLIYQKPELLKKKYYVNCDMRKFIALVIDTLNHDCSISDLLNPQDRIQKILEKHRRHEKF